MFFGVKQLLQGDPLSLLKHFGAFIEVLLPEIFTRLGFQVLLVQVLSSEPTASQQQPARGGVPFHFYYVGSVELSYSSDY